MSRYTNGKATGARLRIILKPNKTNKAGEVVQKTFIIDSRKDYTSGGEAIRVMLIVDDKTEDLQLVTLLRNQKTNREETHEESRSVMAWAFRKVSKSETSLDIHTL